jgi:hypothetical protein
LALRKAVGQLGHANAKPQARLLQVVTLSVGIVPIFLQKKGGACRAALI